MGRLLVMATLILAMPALGAATPVEPDRSNAADLWLDDVGILSAESADLGLGTFAGISPNELVGAVSNYSLDALSLESPVASTGGESLSEILVPNALPSMPEPGAAAPVAPVVDRLPLPGGETGGGSPGGSNSGGEPSNGGGGSSNGSGGGSGSAGGSSGGSSGGSGSGGSSGVGGGSGGTGGSGSGGIVQVPTPSSLLLGGSALIGLLALRRARQTKH